MNGTLDLRPRRLRLDQFDRLTTAKGWTNDSERARALGVARSTMSRVRNRVDRPGLHFMQHACAALDVPVEELFEPDDEQGA